MYGKKLKSALMLLAVCMIFSPRSSITAETSYRTSEYPQMKKALMKGWNTWDTRSVLTHVLLPEGLAVQLQLKSNKTGKILKTALIGRRGKKEEQISPSLRSYDGSYTDLSLRWQGINIRVQSAAINNNLVILVEPDQGSGPGQLIVRPEMFYGREGRIEFGRDMIVARLPSRTAGVFVDGKSPPVFSRHLAMELDGPIGISIGAELSREEIEDIISTARENLLRSKAKYGDLINVHNAQQTALAWNVIYEPTQDRVITPVSRIWNIAWGGYVLFDWDTYFAAYMMSMDSRELAYANAIEVTRGITEDGFIPNYTHPGIWSHKKIRKSLDRSQPPVGSLVVREIYRKYREKWFLWETFDDLLTWNRWWDSNRVTQGYLCWGSNPYRETGRRNPNPMNTDGGKGWQGDTSGQQKPKGSSNEVAASAITNLELEASDFGVFYPHVIYLTDRFFAANKHQGAAWESGLDNSPMYDDIPFNKKTHMMELADVGLISMYIMDCEALADIADELGKTEESAELRARADKYRASLAGLWEDEFGLYLNRRTDTGELSSRISPTNFYPLLARAPSPEQARRMMKEHFDNPEEFWGEYIMPSIARNDPAFADNVYWRGRIWAPMNFLVYMGMRNYDLPEARRDLVEKSRDLLLKSWLSEGHVYENYNATTGVGDDVGNSDKFYHWGALLGFISFIEEGFVSRPEESL